MEMKDVKLKLFDAELLSVVILFRLAPILLSRNQGKLLLRN